MLRKLLVGAVAAVAIGVGASAANAAPPIHVPHVQPTPSMFVPPHRTDFDYVVFVKRGFQWKQYGRYETQWQAEQALRQLERRGRLAKIETVRDRW